jgi:hypothetical protein
MREAFRGPAHEEPVNSYAYFKLSILDHFNPTRRLQK